VGASPLVIVGTSPLVIASRSEAIQGFSALISAGVIPLFFASPKKRDKRKANRGREFDLSPPNPLSERPKGPPPLVESP